MSKHETLVSTFHALETETVKQTRTIGNIPRNKHETVSLKSLALLALNRNKARNNSETMDFKSVSLSIPDETVCTEFYEERAAIAEYDGGLSCKEAETQATQELKAWLNSYTIH